jgi:hypothetical protein
VITQRVETTPAHSDNNPVHPDNDVCHCGMTRCQHYVDPASRAGVACRDFESVPVQTMTEV